MLIQINRSSFFTLTFLSFLSFPWSIAISAPVFSIIPTTPNQTKTSSYGSTSVVYQVTNNSQHQRTLVMEPITGITPSINVQNACTYPFTLQANGGSCLMILNINGSQLDKDVFIGPKVCSMMSNQNNSPNPFLCAQPSPMNSLNTTLGQPYSYITNLGGNAGADGGTVTQCNIDPNTGLFSQCADTGIPSSPNLIPEDVVFVAGGTMAYVLYSDNLNSNAGTIKACKVESNGNLGACFNTSAQPLNRPQALTLNAIGNIAYIVDTPPGSDTTGLGYILQCSVNQTTYDLYSCIATPALNLATVHKPQDIILNTANTAAYIANGVNTLGRTVGVTKCGIDANTGALNSCTDSGAELSVCGDVAKEAIVFNSERTLAYVTCTSGAVMKCNINANTGDLGGCVDSGATLLNYPIGLVFNSANTLAYIANYLDNTVTMCNIDTNSGNLNMCLNAGASELIGPVGISIH